MLVLVDVDLALHTLIESRGFIKGLALYIAGQIYWFNEDDFAHLV